MGEGPTGISDLLFVLSTRYLTFYSETKLFLEAIIRYKMGNKEEQNRKITGTNDSFHDSNLKKSASSLRLIITVLTAWSLDEAAIF